MCPTAFLFLDAYMFEHLTMPFLFNLPNFNVKFLLVLFPVENVKVLFSRIFFRLLPKAINFAVFLVHEFANFPLLILLVFHQIFLSLVQFLVQFFLLCDSVFLQISLHQDDLFRPHFVFFSLFAFGLHQYVQTKVDSGRTNVVACSSSLKHTIGRARLCNGGSHRLRSWLCRLRDVRKEEVTCRRRISLLYLRQSDRRGPLSELYLRLLNNHVRLCISSTLTELFSRLINFYLSSLLNNTINGVN